MGKKKPLCAFIAFFLLLVLAAFGFYQPKLQASKILSEPVQACVIARAEVLDDALRSHIARCLAWQDDCSYPLCRGFYHPIAPETAVPANEVHIQADNVSFYQQEASKLSGHVSVSQTARVVNAETAYLYRNAQTKEIEKIELLGGVRVIEPGRMMIARQASLYPQDKSGQVRDVLYRFDYHWGHLVLPAWGQASLVERFPNEDYWLERATYTTCPPLDKSWHIAAETIALDKDKEMGTARHAKLYFGKYPILYSPYLSFPTSKKRKSGFLIPSIGNTNVSGLDFALPYYWNIAPNYDATITPHIYTKRGLMMGGEFRYLTENMQGQLNGRFLPHDKTYENFIQSNQLDINSTDRWAAQVLHQAQLSERLQFRVNYQRVSDDYFLQNFNSNLAILTERQLVEEGALTYQGEHWLLQGMLQGYQTLKPINETKISDIYQRLPQLLAEGHYDDLPLNSNLTLIGQYDQFNWPNPSIELPDGPRFYFNPIWSLPNVRPWGYLTPSVELVNNAYEVDFHRNLDPFLYQELGSDWNFWNHWNPWTYWPANDFTYAPKLHFQNSIPRAYVDGGLFFERPLSFLHEPMTQTLEPRLFYLRVPYRNQTQIPVYDSAYMIFNTNQLFRTNRFSGFDRIGDTNQLSYALTSRWISDHSGQEKASVTIGQIRYFERRQVGLCQSLSGYCLKENPYALGFLSQTAKSSPLASRAVYHFNPALSAVGDYVWDPATQSTNNTNLNLSYQPAPNRLVNLGYTYLVSGDITQTASSFPDIDPLHQASFSYAWPYNDRWSTLGALSYNISKKYEMLSFIGLQYDTCCWAVRLMGGRSFMSLSQEQRPQYNNNVYLQLQLKGLGSVGNSDPASIIRTFLPGYYDSFHH